MFNQSGSEVGQVSEVLINFYANYSSNWYNPQEKCFKEKGNQATLGVENQVQSIFLDSSLFHSLQYFQKAKKYGSQRWWIKS